MTSSKSKLFTQIVLFIKDTPQKFCRDFGILFGILFLILGFWQPKLGFHFRFEFIAVGTLFCCLSFIFPKIFIPFAAVWRFISVALHFVMSPVILGVLYFLVLAPVGIIFRIFKWNPLRRNLGEMESYWIIRNPPGPSSESFRKQF